MLGSLPSAQIFLAPQESSKIFRVTFFGLAITDEKGSLEANSTVFGASRAPNLMTEVFVDEATTPNASY